MMNFVIFKLGVVVTILVFLSVLSFKILGMVGLVIVLNVAALFAKLAFVSHQPSVPPPYKPQAIHFHVNPSEFYSHQVHRIDDKNEILDLDSRNVLNYNSLKNQEPYIDFTKGRTPAEQIELLNLYKRLGISDSVRGVSNWNNVNYELVNR